MPKFLDLDKKLGSSNDGWIEAGIYVKRKALTGCKEIIKQVEKASVWERALTFANRSENSFVNPERTNTQMHLTRCANTSFPNLKQHDDKFLKAYQAAIIAYVKSNPFVVLCASRDEGITILRYSMGEQYKAHVDDPRYDAPIQDRRVLSGLIYLNDGYEGGYLEFPRHKITIKPETGLLLVFPSNFAYPHVAHPVKKGVKYSAVTWFK